MDGESRSKSHVALAASSGGGRPSRFLAAALSKLELSSTRSQASIGGRPHLLERAEHEERRFLDADSADTRARLRSELVSDEEVELVEEESEDGPHFVHLDSSEAANEQRDAAAMAAEIATRQKTFLTAMDIETQMQMMRAHYTTHRHASSARGQTDEDSDTKEGGSQQRRRDGSKTARISTSHTRRKLTESTGVNGSATARSSKSSHTTRTHLHSHLGSTSNSLSAAGHLASAATLTGSGWTSVGSGGSLAQVFNVASARFPDEEKHELGLSNPVSSYTALMTDLSPAAINTSGRMALKYRLPRSSELEKALFVRALPGTVGIPVATPHSADAFASFLPKRNQLLLNPSSLDPITPGPGAYLGLTRAAYERGKVAELGGVMRTVTATNGILRERHPREDRPPLVAEGSHVADTVSLTKSGRANTSAAYQAAILGTGSLVHLSRRRLRKATPSLYTKPDTSTTTFGAAARPVGEWEVQSRRTFLGPGRYEGSIEGPGISSFAKCGGGTTERLAAARAAAENDATDAADERALTTRGALVAAKLNYAPLPSALAEVPRDALVSVPQDIRRNPGPGAYHPKPASTPHAPAARIVPHVDTVDLDALRRSSESAGGIGAIVAASSSRRSRRRRSGGVLADQDPRVARGYFTPASRSLALATTRTPGPGAYASALFAAVPSAAHASRATDSFAWNHLPNLAAFNSSANGRNGPPPNIIATTHPATETTHAATSPLRAKQILLDESLRRRPEESTTSDVLASVDEAAPDGGAAFSSGRDQKEQKEQSSIHVGPALARELDEPDETLATLEAAAVVRARQLRLLTHSMVRADGRGEMADTQRMLAARESAAAAAARQVAAAASAERESAAREAAVEEHRRKWTAEQRHADARDKNLRLERARADHLRVIESRTVHIAQRSLVTHALQRWFALLTHTRFIYAMWRVNAGRQSVLREVAAAVKIQAGWADFKSRREARERFRALVEKLRSSMLRYVIQHRIRRKRAAGALVARFFRDHLLQRGKRMFRLVQNFKAHVRTIQRFWRRHRARLEASLELHLRAWDAVLHESDAITAQHRRREVMAAAEAQGDAMQPTTPHLLHRALRRSVALDDKAAPSPHHRTHTRAMNALKQFILERLHARRARLELEARQKASTNAPAGGPTGSTSILARNSPSLKPSPGTVRVSISDAGEGASVAVASSGSAEGSAAGETSPYTESYEVERARYRAIFVAPHLKAVAAAAAAAAASSLNGPGVRKSTRDASLAPTPARTPLFDHLRRQYQSELESRPAVRRRDASLALPRSTSIDSTRTGPHGHPIQSDRGAKGSPSSSPSPPRRKRLPTPKSRKPLYTPRTKPSIMVPRAPHNPGVVPPPRASSPSGVLGVVLAAIRAQAEAAKQTAQTTTTTTDPAADGTNNSTSVTGADAATTTAGSNAVDAAHAAEGASSSAVDTSSWRGLSVSVALRTHLLRHALRESRHAFWRRSSLYQHTLDAFLTHRLSSAESGLERARLFLTGTSEKLSADRDAYVRANPPPLRRAILERALLRMLVVQGYVDQADVHDDLTARRAQVLALIQASSQPHSVPDLFHETTTSATDGGGQLSTADRARARKTAAKGFSSVGSSLSPSPVRQMRMQQAAAAAEAAARDGSNSLTPGMPELILSSGDARGPRVTITPAPAPRHPVSSSSHDTATGGTNHANANTPRHTHLTPASPTRRASINTHAVVHTPRAGLLAVDSAATTTGGPDATPGSPLSSPQELHVLFRNHASVSSRTHFPRAPHPILVNTHETENITPLGMGPIVLTPSSAAAAAAAAPPAANVRHARQPTVEASALFRPVVRRTSRMEAHALHSPMSGATSPAAPPFTPGGAAAAHHAPFSIKSTHAHTTQ